MTWLTNLIEKAKKATKNPHSDYGAIVACDARYILALLEVVEVAKHYLEMGAVDESLEHPVLSDALSALEGLEVAKEGEG